MKFKKQIIVLYSGSSLNIISIVLVNSYWTQFMLFDCILFYEFIQKLDINTLFKLNIIE